MLKVILGTLVGFALFIGGVAVGYIALLGIEKDGNLLLLIPSLLLMGSGVFLLFKAGRSDVFKSKIASPNLKPQDQTLFDKNNKMVKEWNKTEGNRDKLKILGASADSQTKI